ncbi:hypothetical protein ACFO8Q_16350 [Effusibacillus consociatus]|uniref:Fur-regulated basic protein FbpA n=1 Tax=Effusibacillus consociatus TaxID=1117041 RepID=A0ABV9Q3Z4_9BACL
MVVITTLQERAAVLLRDLKDKKSVESLIQLHRIFENVERMERLKHETDSDQHNH